MIETLRKINNIVPNLTISQLLEIINIINEPNLIIDNIGKEVPYNGRITIDANDIRSNITYVSQNEILYTDTIKNNIILYRDISEEEYLKVSRLVYVEDIILKNKLSYDYMLEENGANISGGQRQRIILARALLKKGKVILIDEGLNEIDPKLEKKILKNIFREYKDRTLIIISHRKDNIEMYDKVINVSGNEGKEVAHE